MFRNGINSRIPRNLLFLFEVLALILIFINQWETLERSTYIIGIGLILVIYLSNFLLTKISDGDHYIFLIVTMLVSIGLIMIYRIDPELGVKQLLWLSVGIFIFYLTYILVKYIKSWRNMGYLY